MNTLKPGYEEKRKGRMSVTAFSLFKQIKRTLSMYLFFNVRVVSL